MKHLNIFIAFMLCIGLSCSQMQASQTQAQTRQTPAQIVDETAQIAKKAAQVNQPTESSGTLPSGWGWGGLYSSGLETMKSMAGSAASTAASAAGYAKAKATGAVQAAHGTVQNLGYQKVAMAVLAALSVAGYFGISPETVLVMVKNFITQPDLLKRVGQAAVTAGGMAVSGVSAVAASPYTSMAAKGAGLYYLGTVDTQNKYKNLALDVVKDAFSNDKAVNDVVKNIIAAELSNRLLAERNGDANITKGDVTARFDDDEFYFDVLNACRLQTPVDSENRKIINGLIGYFLEDLRKNNSALGLKILGEEKWTKYLQGKSQGSQVSVGATPLAQTTQTVGGTSAPMTGQQQPQPPYKIMKNGTMYQLNFQPVYNSANGYWYGRLASGSDFYFDPTTGLWEKWIPRA